MEKYDLIIVGAGPAGIFTAVELLRHGSKKKMLLVEKGKPVEKRHCPKAEDLNGDGVVAPDVTRTDAEATAVELDHVDESATVEQEERK